jgi:hypothetical protein
MQVESAVSRPSMQFLEELTKWHAALPQTAIALVREIPLDPMSDATDLVVTITKPENSFFLTICRYREAYDANRIYIRGKVCCLQKLGIHERKLVYPGTIVTTLQRASVPDFALFELLRFALANPICLVSIRLLGFEIALQYEYTVNMDCRIRFSRSERYLGTGVAQLPIFQRTCIPIRIWQQA